MSVTQDLLKQAAIATPCPANWNDMPGDERKRFCNQCQLNVYNTSAMSEDEVLDLVLLAATGQRVCARLFKRADGTVITSDCPVGISLLRQRVRKAAAWMAGALSLLVSAAVSAAPVKCKTADKPLFRATVKADQPGAVATSAQPSVAPANEVLGREVTGSANGGMAIIIITQKTLDSAEAELVETARREGRESAKVAWAHKRLAHMYQVLTRPNAEKVEAHSEAAYQLFLKLGDKQNAKQVAEQRQFFRNVRSQASVPMQQLEEGAP